jgi:hypothetical protein
MDICRKALSILCLAGLAITLSPVAMAQQSAPPAAATSPAPATQESPAAQPAAATQPAAAPATAPAAAPTKVTLKEGTEVNLKFAQTLTSKTAVVGDSVDLILDEDLTVGSAIVATKGSHAVATITTAKKAGMMGRGGDLNLHLEYLKAGDNRVKLRGVQGRSGDDKTGATVGLVIAFGVLGFMKHGKQAEVKEGTAIKAFVDQDVELVATGTAVATGKTN